MSDESPRVSRRQLLTGAVLGWLVFQIGEILFPTFGAPEWIFKSLILLIALGFPFALVFAWAFELTPDGIKKTRSGRVDHAEHGQETQSHHDGSAGRSAGLLCLGATG